MRGIKRGQRILGSWDRAITRDHADMSPCDEELVQNMHDHTSSRGCKIKA